MVISSRDGRKTVFACRKRNSSSNKNRLCWKTCAMGMNAEERKIWQKMKNQRERWSKLQKRYENIFKIKF